MAIYLLFMVMPIIVWFLTTLFCRQPINSSDKLKRRYLIICGILLFLMLGLRHYSVGSGDGGWYYNNWRYLSTTSFSAYTKLLNIFDIENGYLTIVWILSHVFKDPQFIFVFYGLLIAISVCRFLYKNCEDVVMGLVMFSTLGLWGFMVQGIRQGAAMCVCLFAVEFCKKRKPIQFFLLVALAAMFHASAVVFAVAYTFAWLKMNVKGYFVVSIGAIVSLLLLDRIFLFVNAVMNDTYEIGFTDDTSGGFVTAAIYILIVVVAVFVFRENDPDTRNIELFFYMTLCGLVTFVMRYGINTIVQRVSYYFMFGEMIVLPAIVNKALAGRQKIFANAVVIALCLGIVAYKASYSTLVPYIFFWQV